MRIFRILWIIPLLFVVSSCETMTDISSDMQDAMGVAASIGADQSSERLIAQGSCPTVEIVEDLGIFYEFVEGADKIPQNMISSAKINHADMTCSYGSQSVTMDTQLSFVSQMGGRSDGRMSFDYPFFVAVTKGNGNILAKEIFPKIVTHDHGQLTKAYREGLRQIIPLEENQDGSGYKVLVGFQLDNEQLTFNRELLLMMEKAQQDMENGIEKPGTPMVPSVETRPHILVQP